MIWRALSSLKHACPPYSIAFETRHYSAWIERARQIARIGNAETLSAAKRLCEIHWKERGQARSGSLLPDAQGGPVTESGVTPPSAGSVTNSPW